MDKTMTQFGVARMIATSVPDHLYRVEADSKILYSVSLFDVVSQDFTALGLPSPRIIFGNIENLQIIFYESDPFLYAVFFNVNKTRFWDRTPLLVEYCITDHRQWLGEFIFDTKFQKYIQSIIDQKSEK